MEQLLMLQNMTYNYKSTNQKVAMETLAIYMLKSHDRMAQELMGWVAPAYSEYLNKIIENGKLHCANLLKEQNYYLKP
eukprot:13839828-Ditylum_brightwellii.AAC.1